MRNTATINGESDEEEVKIVKRQMDMQKVFNSNKLESENLLKNSWHVNIDLPEGNVPEFTYEDTIENAVNEKGYDLGADSHYAIASELDGIFKEKIYFNEANGSYIDKTNIIVSIKYFDKEGREVAANDSTTKVKSFKITVRPKDGKSYQARYLKTGEYFTYTDLSKAGPRAEVISVNEGKIGSIKRRVESRYKKIERLSKGVYKGKDSSGKAIYDFDSSEVSYEESGGKIRYRLMLKTEKDDKTINLHDILPEGGRI